MGKKCSITKELCNGFGCTGYDGTIEKDILIPKNSNAWDGITKVIKEGVWCTSCKEDGIKRVSALHDIVNLGIGEQKKPFNAHNLKNFMDEASCVYNKCKARGDCL